MSANCKLTSVSRTVAYSASSRARSGSLAQSAALSLNSSSSIVCKNWDFVFEFNVALNCSFLWWENSWLRSKIFGASALPSLLMFDFGESKYGRLTSSLSCLLSMLMAGELGSTIILSHKYSSSVLAQLHSVCSQFEFVQNLSAFLRYLLFIWPVEIPPLLSAACGERWGYHGCCNDDTRLP